MSKMSKISKNSIKFLLRIKSLHGLGNFDYIIPKCSLCCALFGAEAAKVGHIGVVRSWEGIA